MTASHQVTGVKGCNVSLDEKEVGVPQYPRCRYTGSPAPRLYFICTTFASIQNRVAQGLIKALLGGLTNHLLREPSLEDLRTLALDAYTHKDEPHLHRRLDPHKDYHVGMDDDNGSVTPHPSSHLSFCSGLILRGNDG